MCSVLIPRLQIWNKFKGNTENASVVNMAFQDLHNKQYKISSYLKQRVYN
jgi:hypothetical protein